MKAYNRFTAAVMLVFVLIIAAANLVMRTKDIQGTRAHRVEIERLVRLIEEKGYESADLSGCVYVKNIVRCDGDDASFYTPESSYEIRETGGEMYRFDYVSAAGADGRKTVLINLLLVGAAAVTAAVIFYIRVKILRPFVRLRDIPYELAKGNPVIPLAESKNRYFGRFVWGVNMLRENTEMQKRREYDLQREKKTLLLSISHDIKTPLSTIKLYSSALSKGLYKDAAKQLEIARSINQKADEIEGYVAQIISASKEDFLGLDVNMGEFYLSELVGKISGYYSDKLALIKTDFEIGTYSDCLIKGDFDRGVEVLQNIIENAIKYGDGRLIKITFDEEEDCRLVTVRNGGCALGEDELPHIFDSFWRGANSRSCKGSGLGLYIGRKLMNKMDGEIFARIEDGSMLVTAVFRLR